MTTDPGSRSTLALAASAILLSTVLAAVAATSAASTPTAATLTARAAAMSPRNCATARGKRLFKSPALEVVEHGTAARGIVYVCVPPNGRLRVAGSAYDAVADGEEEAGQVGYSIHVLATAGSWVAISYRSIVDFHGSEEVDKVSDARSGRSYRFFETGIPEGPGFEGESPPTGQAERVLLNRSGQLAFALVGEPMTQVLGVESNGRRRVLDRAPAAQIPLASLQLTGHRVSWLDAGVARSATL